MMTNENDTSTDTLKESLGLLKTTADNFAEFAIDSDDEMEIDIPLDSPTNVSRNHVTESCNPESTSETGISGVAQLKKVNANDDPITAFFNATETRTNSTMVSSTSNDAARVTMSIAGGENSSESTHTPLPHIPNNTNAQSVTQSLSSTFSSFASKFQDAVSSATLTSALPSAAYPQNSERQVSESRTYQVGQTIVSSNYVDRSSQSNNSVKSSHNVIQPSSSYSSVNSNAPSVYSNVYNQNDAKAQPIYQIGNASLDPMDNSLKS